jgi:hypothetical protein
MPLIFVVNKCPFLKRDRLEAAQGLASLGRE